MTSDVLSRESKTILILEDLAKTENLSMISFVSSVSENGVFFEKNPAVSMREITNKSEISSCILAEFSFKILKYSVCFFSTLPNLPDINNSIAHFRFERGERN